MEYRSSSGNETVDAMGKIAIAGNVTPAEWYKTVLRKNGKPHLLAITILSDIAYWFRPSEVRDENSSQIIGWRKKFSGDTLQRDYNYYVDMLGESKDSIKTAFDLLEELGVLRREFRDLKLINNEWVAFDRHDSNEKKTGKKQFNVMFVYLDVDRLYELTYPEECEKASNNAASDTLPHNNRGGGGKFWGTSPKIFGEVCQNFGGGMPKDSGRVCQNNQGGPQKFSETYTNNTTKTISTEINSIYQLQKKDGMEAYQMWQEYVKENIDYDALVLRYPTKEKMIEELYCIIVDVLVSSKAEMRINGEMVNSNVVKSVYQKLNYEHVEYVLNMLEENTTAVKNVRSYMMTALFNAYRTIGTYYKLAVNHDLYGTSGGE